MCGDGVMPSLPAAALPNLQARWVSPPVMGQLGAKEMQGQVAML